MIMWLVVFRLITQVVGWRDYYSWRQNFGSFYRKCPELHTQMYDMHPHECVSYARICKGVTEIEVRIEANGTQHLCHPRFQPYQKGLYWNLAQVDNIFSCGFQNYYLTLVMELLSDGHYKFYCQNFNDNMNQFCLIMSFQKGSYKCQLCKRPYYGKGQGCQLANGAYDYASMPARQCNHYGCLYCNSDGNCTSCHDGYVAFNKTDCLFSCHPHRSCEPQDWNHAIKYSPSCVQGYQYYNNRCYGIQPCLYAVFNNYEYSCSSCFPGYLLKKALTSKEMYRCYQLDWNCGFSSQSMQVNYQSSGNIYYFTT